MHLLGLLRRAGGFETLLVAPFVSRTFSSIAVKRDQDEVLWSYG